MPPRHRSGKKIAFVSQDVGYAGKRSASIDLSAALHSARDDGNSFPASVRALTEKNKKNP
jgi:hypothetical protein